MTSPRPRLRFPVAMRIRSPAHFKRAYAEGVREDGGAVIVYALPNGLSHPRLGISIGRRAGGAVVRNRFKRLLREAFRLEQHAIGPGIDLVAVVRPHRERPLDVYRALLLRAAKRAGNGIEA